MAKKIEEKANEMLQNGYELVTMSITGTAKAILVLRANRKDYYQTDKLRYIIRKNINIMIKKKGR